MHMLSRPVQEAAENLDRILSATKLLTDPSGMGDHLNCAEADAFADLLRAVGLDEHAEELVRQHATSDQPDDAHYANPNTPSGGAHP